MTSQARYSHTTIQIVICAVACALVHCTSPSPPTKGGPGKRGTNATATTTAAAGTTAEATDGGTVSARKGAEENTPEQILAAITKLNIGTDGGKQVVVTPAQFACGQKSEDIYDSHLRFDWFPDISQQDCHGERQGYGGLRPLRWMQQKPAKYGPDPLHGPAQDAQALLDAALFLHKLSVIKPDAELGSLEQHLQRVAAMETSLASTSKDLADAEDELADSKDQRKAYTLLRAFMIADHGDNTYEIATSLNGHHALLRTTSTSFTSRGAFRLWVTKEDDEDVTTTDGFHQSWHVYREADRDEVKELDQGIAKDAKKIQALRKVEKTLTRKFLSERKFVGVALNEFLAKKQAGTTSKVHPIKVSGAEKKKIAK